jgi:hypothetical protein
MMGLHLLCTPEVAKLADLSCMMVSNKGLKEQPDTVSVSSLQVERKVY